MMWLPRSRYISAIPLMARLLLSVAPEVKMISLAVAPISLAICSRAVSTPCSASQPKEWLRLGGVADFSVEKGRHAPPQPRGVGLGGGVFINVNRHRNAIGRRYASIFGMNHFLPSPASRLR